MQVVPDRIDGSCDCQRNTFIEGRTIHEVRHYAVVILLMAVCLTRHWRLDARIHRADCEPRVLRTYRNIEMCKVFRHVASHPSATTKSVNLQTLPREETFVVGLISCAGCRQTGVIVKHAAHGAGRTNSTPSWSRYSWRRAPRRPNSSVRWVDERLRRRRDARSVYAAAVKARPGWIWNTRTTRRPALPGEVISIA